MKQLLLVPIFLLFSAGLAVGQAAKPRITDRSFGSRDPALDLSIQKPFRYVGSFEFTVAKMSSGRRYVFVDSDRKKNVRRLVILQFEKILPTSGEIYRYSFADAEQIGPYKWRHNTFAFSNDAGKKENPSSEGVLTVDFLLRKRFVLSDEWMAARSVAVPTEDKKQEIIIFYLEPISSTGHRMSEFYSGDDRTPLWTGLSKELMARFRTAVTIHP